ncbi:hypothetical protein ACWEQ4_01105 [Rhodococcus sp. NPDC003994]
MSTLLYIGVFAGALAAVAGGIGLLFQSLGEVRRGPLVASVVLVLAGILVFDWTMDQLNERRDAQQQHCEAAGGELVRDVNQPERLCVNGTPVTPTP